MKSIHPSFCSKVVLWAFVSLGISAEPLAGQAANAVSGSAAVTGTVLDASGKALPGATIVIRNESGSGKVTVVSDPDGHFRIADLASGTYNIDTSASGFATTSRTGVRLASGVTEDLSITLNVGSVTQAVTVDASAVLPAVQTAPSQSPLNATTAESVISSTYIQNFMAPTGDFSDVILMSPGTFSVPVNGPGLGDTKTFFRGFKDGFYNMTFDGIPFNDTNDPTHHSWVWFPAPFIGSTVFDRSPGDATSIGPSNSGGSINLLSHDLSPDQDIRATVSYGSFNTRFLALDYDSGPFGGKGRKSNLLLNVHNLNSDGYQTFNFQDRWGGSAKYQYRVNEKTILTAFTGIIDLASNTPNTKGPTRTQVAVFGDNYLLNNNPADPLYYRYSYYQIPTDFEYVGVRSELGAGWKVEDKAYSNRYYNHQQYNGSSISATSGTDKLNSYRKVGNILSFSQESRWGILRTGFWYEWANTDRYQIPTDPRTWKDAPLPNFHEKFITQSTQPFVQYEFRPVSRLGVTVGLHESGYNIHLDQFADNGKTVGKLGGVAFVTHGANYTKWQPTANAHYRITNNWSAYGQYATGNVIPPSSVFDVKNGLVAVVPKPTGTRTFQFGSVLRFNRLTMDADAYFIRAENPYSSSPDPTTGEPVYFAAGNTVSKGVEAETNLLLGRGFNLYLNGTAGTAKYSDTHLWVQNSPRDTETVGLTYMRRAWDIGFFNKRVGQLYNDNGGTNQAVKIDPFNITNLFFNYSLRESSRFRGTKIRLSINNLFDQHNIVGVTPASTKTSVPAPGDQLTLMAGRSVVLSMTFGFVPKR